MKVHVIRAWVVSRLSYHEMVYDEQTALNLQDQGYKVTYEPQHRTCVLDRPKNPYTYCYMCTRGDSSYYAD